jgi:hypothetical protein
MLQQGSSHQTIHKYTARPTMTSQELNSRGGMGSNYVLHIMLCQSMGPQRLFLQDLILSLFFKLYACGVSAIASKRQS